MEGIFASVLRYQNPKLGTLPMNLELKQMNEDLSLLALILDRLNRMRHMIVQGNHILSVERLEHPSHLEQPSTHQGKRPLHMHALFLGELLHLPNLEPYP